MSLYLPVVASISREGVDVGWVEISSTVSLDNIWFTVIRKRMGIALFPVGIASLVGTPIGGALIGHEYVWWKGVVFAAVSPQYTPTSIYLRFIRLPGWQAL